MFSAFQTFGKLGALASSVARAWSPLALWPDGISSAGMWISPRDLTSQWADYTGTTPVATPGTVADSSNPVGLALDIRAGTPVLGPELVTNGDFSAGMAGWTLAGYTTAGTPSGGSVRLSGIAPDTNFNPIAYQTLTTVVGRTYKISFPHTFVAGIVGIACYASGIGIGFITVLPSSGGIHIQATSTTTTLAIYALNGASTDVPFDVTVGPATVKEVPGNHMLQSTSAARPLLSARVNLLTYTEDFSNAAWDKQATLTSTGLACPLGNNAALFTFYADGGSGIARFSTLPAASLEYYLKYGSWRWFEVTTVSGAASRSWVDLQNGVAGTVSPNHIGFTVTPVGDGWVKIAFSFATTISELYLVSPRSANGSAAGAVGNSGTTFSLSPAQLNLGSTAHPYQRVGAASDYNATGFPIAQKYDGVDDGMATAAFAAGTLIDGMDCMIPVRRDSAAATYLISDTGSRGFFAWESGSTSRPDVSAGTPTYYVDGVAVTATKGALFTALTAGDWHILEARGLDLSTWLKVEVSSLVSYRLNGARGDIMLYPSTDPTADKDAARQWLADYYGVTLA